MDVVSFKCLDDYELDLTFANGEVRRFDMKPLLKIKPWSNLLEQNRYSQLAIDYGTIVWGEDIDLAPEALYLDSVPLSTIKTNP
jgi:hypothetical protein